MIPNVQLPESIVERLAAYHAGMVSAIADDVRDICDAAHRVGYEQGWHAGWEAAEAEVAEETPDVG